MDGILLVVLISVIVAVGRRFASKPQPTALEVAQAEFFARARQKADAGFDLYQRLPDLREYVRISSQFIGLDILASPPVAELPADDGRPIDYVKRAVQVSVSRFGIALPQIKVRFSSLPPGRAAQVQRDRDGTWKVDVDESLEAHNEPILSAVAHEVAHVALLPRRKALEPQQREEELTDVAAVLAGFGPVMLRTVLWERVAVSDSSVQAQTNSLGYLPPKALVFLSTLRVEMAGGHAEFYADHVPSWQRSAVDAYIALRDDWTRSAAPRRGSSVPCFACAMPLRLPTERAKIRIRCRTCGFRAILPAAT
jgi:hypothetical protein